MKDKINYKVQFFDDNIDDWYTLDSGIKSKKEAKSIVRDFKAAVSFQREIVCETLSGIWKEVKDEKTN